MVRVIVFKRNAADGSLKIIKKLKITWVTEKLMWTVIIAGTEDDLVNNFNFIKTKDSSSSEGGVRRLSS